MSRLTRRVLLGGLLALPLAACGRQGPPSRPDTADPASPRRYPDPRTVVPRREGTRPAPQPLPDSSQRGPQGPDGGLGQDPAMEPDPWGDPPVGDDPWSRDDDRFSW